MNLEFLANHCLELAIKAAAAVEQVKAQGIQVDVKADDSPVTQADLASEAIIVQGLKALASKGYDFPCLSEESAQAFEGVANYFWCVDPLDGTKDFIHQTGDYTINIALFEANEPVLGVVAVPQTHTFYLGYKGGGSWIITPSTKQPIACRTLDPKQVVTVISRFHVEPEFNSKLDALPEIKKCEVGSALKFCILANGQADFYPRLGPTSVWDIAAGHCILREAGGELYNLDHSRLNYELHKPWKMKPFYAVGDKKASWKEILNQIL